MSFDNEEHQANDNIACDISDKCADRCDDVCAECQSIGDEIKAAPADWVSVFDEKFRSIFE